MRGIIVRSAAIVAAGAALAVPLAVSAAASGASGTALSRAVLAGYQKASPGGFGPGGYGPGGYGQGGPGGSGTDPAASYRTTTPIKHVVVIFDENVSFDHYFATYPDATNPPGEPAFNALPGTPSVNGLAGNLLSNNPNEANPQLLGPSDAMTCDQDHGYAAEQGAADHGAEDQYVQDTGHGLTLAQCLQEENKGLSRPSPIPVSSTPNFAALDYYDGNTVTALWNYAQHFSMSDNAFGTTYGPSTPGALNVTSAQAYGAICGPSFATINDSPCSAPPGYNASDVATSQITTMTGNAGTTPVADQPPAGPGTVYNDTDPYFDICSYIPSGAGGDGATPVQTIEMGGNNIGEELTSSGITWGWFQGGFEDGYVPGHGTPPTIQQICSESHQNVGGATVTDYIPHHEPFQYYASTANPMHLPPTSVAMIGRTDQANHQYGIGDFWAAADAGNLPAVSYLKAPAYEDGHAGYSDPLDEQRWLVTTINHLESLPTWRSTAVLVTWDDSDGWYDHVLAPILSSSAVPALDSLTAAGMCGPSKLIPVTSSGMPEEGKCGPGPRLPFLVISPWAKSNYVSNVMIDQSSVVSFIEQNWDLPALGNGAADSWAGSLDSMFDFSHPAAPKLYLDPATGEAVQGFGPGRYTGER
ncbi:MAG: phospholipase C [Acidimicrobiales bacterium]